MSYQEKGSSEEKIRILHVDDDSSILVTSKQILNILNPAFEVDSANSVDEALCKLGQCKYDVVVSDYEMPEKSGLDLLVELRNNKNSTPLIIFTGRGREEVAIKALNLGASGYYDKHGNPETVFGELAHGIKAVIDYRRTQQALAHSEAKFTRAFQNGPVAITITRLNDGKVVEANNSTQTVLGYTPGELIGKSTIELGIWRDPQDREEIMAKLTDKGSISDEELVINKKDGSIITVLLSASLIELQNEACLIASFTDVTALKKTGDELREKELRYRLLADNARDVIWTMDLEGHFTYVSPSVHKLRGYTPEEVIKQPITEALTPESASLILEALQSSLKEYSETGKIPKPNTFRLQQPCKDGSNVWTEVNYSVITDNEGKPQSILGVSRDITERMKAEELVKRSNQTIDSIINSTTDLVFALDSNWNFIYANKQTAKLVGLEPAGLVGKNGWEIFPGAIGTNLEKGLREAMDERVPKRVVFENPKAGLVWENNIFPIDNGLTVFVKDITERKIAEAQLEERYQAIARVAESINSGLVMIGKDYRVIWANDRLQKIGLKPNNICHHVFGLTQPCPDCGVKKVFENNISLDIRDFKSTKYGSKSWIELRVTPLKGRDGQIIAALELAIPIDERKKAEEALRESEERFRTAFEASQQASFISTLEEGVFIEVNDAFAKLLQVPRKDCVGKTVLDLGIYANGLTDRKKMLAEINSKGHFRNLEFDGILGNEPRSIILSGQIIQLKGKNHIYGTITDVTQEKKISQLFRESEEKFRKAFETGPDGIYISSLDEGKIVDVNDRMVDLFGFTREELIGKTTKEIGVWCNPEDRERMLSLLRTEGKLKNVEISYRKKNSEVFHALQSVSILEVNNQKLTLGTIKDITRRKISEQQLKESHSELQVANEKLKVVGSLTRHDVRNKLSIVNTNLYLLKKQVMDNPLALKYIAAIELATKQSDKIFEFTSQYEKIGLEKIGDIDVGETFNQALRNTPEAAKIAVTNNAVGLTVRADSLLQQLFYNLVDNSLRHGEHVTEISLSYEDSTDCIRLVYEDNGVGVPNANKERIFLGGFTTGHGSGLGLMIVKKMIETYGWKIKEDGEEGKGARFTIAIPRSVAS